MESVDGVLEVYVCTEIKHIYSGIKTIFVLCNLLLVPIENCMFMYVCMYVSV